MTEDRAAEQRAAFMRRFERLVEANRALRDHRLRLTLRVSGLTGEPWEDVMASLGVDVSVGTGRDPHPSAATGMVGTASQGATPGSSPGEGRTQPLWPADLTEEDDDGNHSTMLDRSTFDPARIYPGALLVAGTQDFHAPVTVVRTELHHDPDGRQLILVTFTLGFV